MTNEQKQAIRDAAKTAWYDGNHWDAVLAAIEKYDELANKDFDSFVKNFIHLFDPSKENKPPEPSQDNEYIALFIPAGEDENKHIRIFNSAAEMFARLSVEFKSDIAISDSHVDKSDSDWPIPKYLYKIYLDKNKIVHIGEYIGICDYLSFKKG